MTAIPVAYAGSFSFGGIPFSARLFVKPAETDVTKAMTRLPSRLFARLIVLERSDKATVA